MMVELKDGRCRSCDSQLEIVDVEDDMLIVECSECGDSYTVEGDAFADGCMHYLPQFLAGRMAGDGSE